MSKKVLFVGSITIQGAVEIDMDSEEVSVHRVGAQINLEPVDVGDEETHAEDAHDMKKIAALRMVGLTHAHIREEAKRLEQGLREEAGEVSMLPPLKGFKS